MVDGMAYEELQFASQAGPAPMSGLRMAGSAIHFYFQGTVEVFPPQGAEEFRQFQHFAGGVFRFCFQEFFPGTGIIIDFA